ncbi:MFS transporter [Haloferula helveola]
MSDLQPSQKRAAALIVAAQSCTKLGDVLTNPKTVLTWLLSSLGTSGAVLSMLVPVRESGSMLPQLFVSGWVQRFQRRKWVFAGGAIGQAVCIASMGAAALVCPPTAAGVVIVVALAGFAFARSFCSISSKDVLGRTIPKGFRGRVGGLSNAISGVLSAGAAVALLVGPERDATRFLAWLVLGASMLWVLGAAAYAMVKEPVPESEESGEQPAATIGSRLRMVRDDRRFRRFVIARSLLLGSSLASPLFVVLGHGGNASMGALVGFLVASGVASGTSSFLWGKLADRAGRLAMAFGGAVAAFVGFSAMLIAWRAPGWSGHFLVWPFLYLLFNIGYAGVRLGRKTWVVDAAEGDRRTDYVSASNTLIAVIILIVGALASPLQAWSPLALLAVYSVFCAVGGLAASGLAAERD